MGNCKWKCLQYHQVHWKCGWVRIKLPPVGAQPKPQPTKPEPKSTPLSGPGKDTGKGSRKGADKGNGKSKPDTTPMPKKQPKIEHVLASDGRPKETPKAAEAAAATSVRSASHAYENPTKQLGRLVAEMN